MLEFTQAEIITRTIIVLSSLAGLGWGVIGLRLHISRSATLHFCFANVAIALAYWLALVCTPTHKLVYYYQSFNWTDIFLLVATMLIHAGLRQLHRAYVPQTRVWLALGVLILLAFVPLPGVQFSVAMLVLLASGWYAFSAFSDCNQVLRKHFAFSTRLMLIWPLAAAGVLFYLRVADDFLTSLQTYDEMIRRGSDQQTQARLLVAFIWMGLLIAILLNASLIGLTLNKLFKSVNDQANRLQHILDTAPVGVLINAGGKVRFANPCATKMLDLAVDDEASRMLVHPADYEKILHQLKAKNTVNNMEIQMISPQKTVRDILVTYLTTNFEDEPGILGWMIDITERKQADQAIRQANREQNAIFESATLGIALIKNDVVVRANQRLENLFGWELGSMVGQSAQIWYGNALDSAAAESDPLFDIERGAIHNSTRKLRRKDGTLFWCRMSGSAIDASDWRKGTVWMFDDVTVEHNALQMVRQSKELAEEATRMKSNFLANMSHEIRTPMNAIIGMMHLALKTELSAKQKNYIEKADAAAHNLLGIINDILDFSRIEAGKMHFEEMPFDLDEVLENLADICTAKAQDKGVELLFDIGPDVPTALIGDPLRLGQVVLNLVGNAIKFTEAGEITLGIHMANNMLPANAANAANAAVCLHFDITDTGVGLTPDQQNKLFSAFSQADTSTTRKYGGTGLGLSICKRLVELMHGQIGVMSEPGVGSTFYFTAYFGRQEHQRPTMMQDRESDALRILVVDDNARARQIMLAMLASQKFTAAAVGSGAEAMLALKAGQEAGEPYGLVLIDWMMPGLDGLATICEIRAEPTLRDLPAFMMVTAHNQDELLEQAEGIKIDGLLQKPVNPSALLDTILSILGRALFSYGRKQRRRVANYDAEAHLQGLTLLLVEDNPVNQELALEILQQGGMHVDVASNGAQALDMLACNTYDGVLMDCQMPVMDGFEATRKIRAQPRFAQLPILAMTANALISDKEDCLAAGMNDHIGKPIDVDQLFATLVRWTKPITRQGIDTDNTLLNEMPKGRGTHNPDRSVDQSSPNRLNSPGVAMHETMPAMAQLGALAQIPSLDLALAMRRMRGNSKLMRKLIDRFVETQADALTRIKTALDANDLQSAIRDAHSLKGLAGNIGASQLQICAGAFELALRYGEPIAPAFDKMAQELPPLIARIAAAVALIHTEAPTEMQSPREEPNSQHHWHQQLRQTLPELAELLSHDDTGSVMLCERISEPLRNLGQGVALAQMRKLMSKYQFEEALGIVKAMAHALDIPLKS